MAGRSLEWYDYGARFYDPSGVLFTTMDPLAEKYNFQSPYCYASNNPIRYRDVNGMGPDDDETGLIRNATDMQRTYQPVEAAMKDFSAFALNNFTPLGAIDDAIVTYNDPSSTTNDKINASLNVFFACIIIKGEGTPSGKSNIKTGDYSGLKQPTTIKEGAPFTKAQKERILQENKARNGGELRSDLSGKKVDAPTQSKKGEKANMNQAEIDHKKAKSNGGSNSNDNAQVLSKEENLKKSNKANP